VQATDSVVDGAWRPSLNDVFSRGLLESTSYDVLTSLLRHER
jgi:hypothetical protein